MNGPSLKLQAAVMWGIGDTSRMRLSRGWSVPALCLVLPAIASASDVKTDFDPAVEFTKFKTYSFIERQELGKTGLLSNPEVRERIQNFISGVMESRGLKEMPRDTQYDLAVRYWVARRHKTDEKLVYDDDECGRGIRHTGLGLGAGTTRST
jgi:uncharacterized protein DUF4136